MSPLTGLGETVGMANVRRYETLISDTDRAGLKNAYNKNNVNIISIRNGHATISLDAAKSDRHVYFIGYLFPDHIACSL